MPACITQRNRGPCAYVEALCKRGPGASGLARDVANRGLSNRAHHHLVDVHTGWPGHGPDDAISDIGAGQGHHALVDRVGALLVALEAHQAELRFYHAWLDLRHADGLAEEFQPERLGDGPHGVLAGGITDAAGVELKAGDGAQVNDVSARGAT